MKKYFVLLKIRIQSRFSYRWHVFFEFFFKLIPIGILILVWRKGVAGYCEVDKKKYTLYNRKVKI
jgi:ABC-type uncharacterized transport system permease subunit